MKKKRLLMLPCIVLLIFLVNASLFAQAANSQKAAQLNFSGKKLVPKKLLNPV